MCVLLRVYVDKWFFFFCFNKKGDSFTVSVIRFFFFNKIKLSYFKYRLFKKNVSFFLFGGRGMLFYKIYKHADTFVKIYIKHSLQISLQI